MINEALPYAISALQVAQNNLASRRPLGSADPESPQYDHDAFMWDYYQRAIDNCNAALALPAAPADAVTLLGVRSDGSSVNLGQIATPARMKAREIIRNYIGEPGDPAGDDDDSEATNALRCCIDLIAYMRAVSV